MSNDTLTKEQYLDRLATNAATKIAEGTTPRTMEIMVPHWKAIILNELSPILELIS